MSLIVIGSETSRFQIVGLSHALNRIQSNPSFKGKEASNLLGNKMYVR